MLIELSYTSQARQLSVAMAMAPAPKLTAEAKADAQRWRPLHLEKFRDGRRYGKFSIAQTAKFPKIVFDNVFLTDFYVFLHFSFDFKDFQQFPKKN